MFELTGRIHSVQTMGTLDGPGVRYVVFMQGCPLRCACCHNPDTWEFGGGEEKTPGELLADIKRYQSYFGSEGGVTVSGGEALMQAEFVGALFRQCKAEGIHTCLDTSGYAMDEQVKALLKYTDLVLLDVKYTTEEDYKKYVEGSLQKTLEFLSVLENNKVTTWLRQVIIKGINDNKTNLRRLAKIAAAHNCVQKTELLAFRKLCLSKYNEMNLKFPFAHMPETSNARIQELSERLKAYIRAEKEDEPGGMPNHEKE